MREPTVLFDLGNVLVRLNVPRGLDHFRRLVGGKAPASVEAAQVFMSSQALSFNRGAYSPERFLEALAVRLSTEVARARIAEAWCDIFDAWPEMEALADEVLALGHRAYLASNTDAIHFAFLSMRMPVLQRLTGCHLSYEAGLIKPDPEFFRALLARFKLSAADCVYLDDHPPHVEAAIAVGIRAQVHDGDVGRARRFLRENGVDVAQNP